jgi:hypothetical protein
VKPCALRGFPSFSTFNQSFLSTWSTTNVLRAREPTPVNPNSALLAAKQPENKPTAQAAGEKERMVKNAEEATEQQMASNNPPRFVGLG